MTKFHDAAERAPVGGWHYYYDPADGSTMFKLSSPDAVIDEVVKYRRNNGKPAVRAAIEEELWKYWCSRDPVRCGQSAPSKIAPFLPRELTPKVWGPWIWPFLNLAAVRFDNIGPERFFGILASIMPMMTCPECQHHWAVILEANPPEISSAKDACRWVNKVHGLVSELIGNPPYPYERMVLEYGAPLP